MKYINLFLMAGLSFFSMYILMYIMVNSIDNVFHNLNQIYMAGVMTLPMIVIELLLMKSMYTNKKLNTVIIFCSLILFIVLIFFIRNQTAITDKEFLKSMIPHHAAALLMCESAQLHNPEIKKLCETIKSTQQFEIDFMKRKLTEQA